MIFQYVSDQVIRVTQDDGSPIGFLPVTERICQKAISEDKVLPAPTPPPSPAIPDYGADVPDDYAFRMSDTVVPALRQYVNLAAPTAAQTQAVVKLMARVMLWMLKRQRF